MNTLNLYIPENKSNIFLYFYIDYTDTNMKKIEKDIKVMTLKKQSKRKVKVIPQI